jgi:succinate dehydrogenase / fumarate reductase iron-sulfur subunit
MAYNAHFRVWRGGSSGGRHGSDSTAAGDGALQDYEVEVNEGEVVLDIIHRLQATQAPDLAVRWNCKAGKCGSCSAEVNGKPVLMCMTRMSTFTPDQTITVTPLRTFPVIRDLVTDVSFNYTKAREVPAFAGPTDLAPGEYRMAQVDVERSQEFRKCIECFLCQDVCHVIRDHEANKPAFAGPRFFIRLAELDMHPLDTLDRKRAAQESHGLGLCNITKCCTEVCPEHIKITDNGIIPMKERVVDTKYDPIVWLGNRIPRRDTIAAGRALDAGDAIAAESKAQARLREKPADRAAQTTLSAALCAQARFAEASDVAKTLVDSAGRSKTAREQALDDYTWALLCAVEAGQLDAERVRPAVEKSLEDAARLVSSGTTRDGTRALAAVTYGRLEEAERLANSTLSWNRSADEQADARLTLARAFALSGRGEEARATVEQARKGWPANPRLPFVAEYLDIPSLAPRP